MIHECRHTWERLDSAPCSPLTPLQENGWLLLHQEARRPGGSAGLVVQPRTFLSTWAVALAPRFVAPFPIAKVINPVVVKLKLPRTMRMHPMFNVSRVKPVVESPWVPASLLPPRLLDGEPIYTVKKRLAVYHRGQGHQYLVDWEGYGPEKRSLIPSRDIVDPYFIWFPQTTPWRNWVKMITAFCQPLFVPFCSGQIKPFNHSVTCLNSTMAELYVISLSGANHYSSQLKWPRQRKW